MRFKKIINLFKKGNVSVCGLKGTGKDMLMANVVCRRKEKYISNITYDEEKHIEFDPTVIKIGNSYKNIIEGNIQQYIYPYDDGTDIYISDAGIYFPSQYCNELNKEYKDIPTFMALSRHLGECNVHYNSQNLNRVWDKIREQSDTYINLRWTIVIPIINVVIQKIRIYEYYESAVKHKKPFCLKMPLFANKEMRLQREIQKQNYENTNGAIKGGLLVYVNKSKYNTRKFKEMFEKEKKQI